MKKLLLPLAMVFVLGGCASYQYTARTVGVGTQPIGAKEVVAEVVQSITYTRDIKHIKSSMIFEIIELF